MRRFAAGFITALALSAASTAAATQWSPWFTRTEHLKDTVHTVVVPVRIQGVTYACVISEDTTGYSGVALAQSCDFGVGR